MNIQNYPKVHINFSPKIPALKKIQDKTKVDVRYCLVEPFAFVHIYWDSKIYELVYEIEEPVLNEKEEKQKTQIVSAMRDMINFQTVVAKNQEKLLEYIDTRFKLLAVELGMNIPYESYKKIYYYLCRNFMGFDEVDPLLRVYLVNLGERIIWN